MMTSKTPCLRSLWTNYGIKVMECFIFAETLYSFTQLMVEYPLRGLITKYLNSCLTQPQHKNQALHGHLESTTPMFEDISNQDLILQRSLFTIWTIGFVIHLVQVYYNLDYWTHHSLGSELFQPSKTSRIWISDSTNPWTPHKDLPLLEH